MRRGSSCPGSRATSAGVRVFGRADIPSHLIDGDSEYDSGGWFGQKKVVENSPRAESIFGDKQLAHALLLDRAQSGDTGTSALIVDFYEPEEDESRPLEQIAESIIASSERWFWPSMSGKKPSLEVEVLVERDGKCTFKKAANPAEAWQPFIAARENAPTGPKARAPSEVAETLLPFRVPQRELPAAEQHAAFDASLRLRVGRGTEDLADHERANCIAVFRGPEMVVKYVPLRKPFDDLPLFGVLMAGRAVGTQAEDAKAEEFFRAAEPPLHNEWEYSDAVRNSYRKGAKQALQKLWTTLPDKAFELIDENVTPKEQGPQLLSKLFPMGQAGAKGTKHIITTKLISSSYLGGKWKIKGEVSNSKPTTTQWKARIGLMALTDSGPAEYLSVASLTTNKKAARVAELGPPAVVSADPSIDSFQFEAVLEPPESLNKTDLDLTAIRLASGEAPK